MASQENFFTPEEVDEQLEMIEQTGQASARDRRLIEALSMALSEQQASTSLLDENHERMLARVLSRLLSAEEMLHAEQANLPPVLPRDKMPSVLQQLSAEAEQGTRGQNLILPRGNRAQRDRKPSLSSLVPPSRYMNLFFRAKERFMLTNFPKSDHAEPASSDLVPPERTLFSSQASLLPRRKAPVWSMIGAVLAAVLLVVMLIGTLQLTRQHPAPSTQIAHRGSTNVFQGGPYLIQARDNGDGLPIPNPDATILIPKVSLAPSWSYEVTMTQVHESATPQYGSSFGLILAKTKEKAYALTFSDERGKLVAFLYNYEWSPIYQQYHNGQYDSPPYVNTPVAPASLFWNISNLASFHTGLNVANTVRITATAHTLTIMVNGELVGTIQNFTLGSGQFGMFVNTKGTAVRFQNVQITQE